MMRKKVNQKIYYLFFALLVFMIGSKSVLAAVPNISLTVHSTITAAHSKDDVQETVSPRFILSYPPCSEEVIYEIHYKLDGSAATRLNGQYAVCSPDAEQNVKYIILPIDGTSSSPEHTIELWIKDQNSEDRSNSVSTRFLV